MSVVSRQKNWVVTVNNYTLSPYCCHLRLLVQIQNSFKNNHICRNTGRSNRFILAYFQNMYRICLTSGWMKNGLFFTLESNSDLRYYTPGKFWFKPIKSTWAPRDILIPEVLNQLCYKIQPSMLRCWLVPKPKLIPATLSYLNFSTSSLY